MKRVSMAPDGDTVEKKKKLFDDASSSEDDQEDGGAALKINSEFARRFEHNKKREEVHRLEEKLKKNGKTLEGSDSDSSSDDETEDEAGLLITEDLDKEISATLQAIKNKDPRIYDKNATFYKPFDPEKDIATAEKKDKPVTIRDYHRERYLAGDVGAEDDAADKPKTYVQEQEELKKSIVSEFHAAAADDSEEWSDDEAFIKKKEKPQEQLNADGVHPSRQAAVKITEVDVKEADKDPEGYLQKFMASKAWAPAEGSNWQAFDSDEDDEQDDLAEQFEHAYNMRFEDPDKANEVLKSYSRSLVAAKSVRKEEVKGRKKQRQLEKEKKEAEKAAREEERKRLRKLKIEEAEDKLRKIKQAAGISGKNITDEEWVQFLDEAWEDDKWEEEMRRRFGDDYYAEVDEDMKVEVSEDEEEEDDEKKKTKPKKPKWDDDIDIKDIIPDFEEELTPAVPLEELKKEIIGDDVDDNESEEEEEDGEDRPAKKRKTTKNIKREKQEAKREGRRELARIEALVDSKLEIEQPRVLVSSSKSTGGFRYRETSPITFGMTARDILLAPSDAALNEFAGLKKLATFRDPEKKKKDKKRLGKKARLRQWRKETFGPEFERTGPTFGFAEPEAMPQQQQGPAKGKEAEDEPMPGADGGNGGIVEGERKKKRKRSKGKKAGTA
jgi:protein KRI1